MPRRTDRASFISSAGRAYRPAGGGFFVLPKVMLVIAIEGSTRAPAGENPAVPMLRTPEVQSSLGFDIGQTFRFERWSITLVTGLSAGYVWGTAQPSRGIFGSLISPVGHLHRGGVLPANAVVDVNLNLVRLGVRF